MVHNIDIFVFIQTKIGTQFAVHYFLRGLCKKYSHFIFSFDDMNISVASKIEIENWSSESYIPFSSLYQVFSQVA